MSPEPKRLRMAAAYERSMITVLGRGLVRGDLRRDLNAGYTAKARWLAHLSLIREIFIDSSTGTRGGCDRLDQATVGLILAGPGARDASGDESDGS